MRFEAVASRSLGRELGGEVPVAGGDEREALALAVDDEAGRGGLHAAGREARADLAPQHGRDLVAVEPVEDAAGLLRVDEGGVEVAGVLLRALDRLLGDLVEHHALDRHLGLQHLEQVPGDGLALAVLISCEVELVGVLERALELGDRLLLLRR